MVPWQIERGSGGCLNFEELNSIVSVLCAFNWNLFSVIQSICQIYRFGERSWCHHNVIDYIICAAECHQQRIGEDMSG